MPTFSCPVSGCGFVTEDVSDAVAIVMLQIHAGAVHHPTTTTRVKAPRIERPHIDSGVEPVVWNNFLRRWELFRAGSEIDDDAAPLQFFERASERLGDMVLKADTGPAIVSRSLDVVITTVRRFAVVPVAISVMRAELLQLQQAPDEQFRAFSARVQGKAETCSFSTAFTCTCGTTAAADYTTEMTRDLLLAGITDTDIRRETLGTPDVHRLPINAIITLVESKEMARDALPSASQSAVSTFKRSTCLAHHHQASSTPPGDGLQKLECPGCGQLFSPFTKLRSGWNKVPHKVCKACYLKQHRPKRTDVPVPSKTNAINVSTDDNIIIASAMASPARRSRRRRGRRHGHIITLDHHIFSGGEWRRAKLQDHPRVQVNVSIVDVNSKQAPSCAYSKQLYAVTDSGAQSNIWSLKDFDAAGFPRSALSPVSLSLKAANSSRITVHGAFFARIDGKAQDGSITSCQAMIYVSDQVRGLFLSFDTMVDLLIVGRDFPSIGSAKMDIKLPNCSSHLHTLPSYQLPRDVL